LILEKIMGVPRLLKNLIKKALKSLKKQWRVYERKQYSIKDSQEIQSYNQFKTLSTGSTRIY
jgi:hypothetical protein